MRTPWLCSPGTPCRYVSEVALQPPPEHLDAAVRLLVASSEAIEAVSPTARRGCHPLLIPLARDASSGAVTGLLRWPTSADAARGMPLVRTARGGANLELLALSAREYAQRRLAEADMEGEEAYVAAVDAAGERTAQLYAKGDFAATGLPALAYLTRHVGRFPDVIEGLCEGHLSRGDEISGLTAAELPTKSNWFPGFARTYAYLAERLHETDRPLEQRDIARAALRLPWWSLGASDFYRTAELAQYGAAEEVTADFVIERIAAERAAEEGEAATKPDPATKALNDAHNLMCTVAAREGGVWAEEEVTRLAELLEKGNCPGAAHFVSAWHDSED